MHTRAFPTKLHLVALALPACVYLLPLACSHTSSSAGTGGAGSGTGGSGTGGAVGAPGPVARHSSSIAVSPDGTRIYVVNADADSVSEIDAVGRKLVREIPLASGPPAVDANGRYTPAVGPRALALSPRAGMLYVTGERSGQLHGIDLATGTVTTNVVVGSEPIGVLVAPDESAVFVACSNDGTVVKVDVSSPGKAAVSATAHLTDGTSPAGVPIQAEPWALGFSLDGSTLYATHMLAPNVDALDPATLAPKVTMSIPDTGAPTNTLLANGTSRGLYDVVARPGSSGEIWVPHLMLAITTAQPTLDFESTAFPTISVFSSAGAFVTRMSSNAMSISGDNGAFGDIVSGPRALEFTADGSYAIMLDSASEDLLAVDASMKVEATLLRPLGAATSTAGHLQEGLVLSPDGKYVYIDERNTSDVAIVDVDESGGTINLTFDASIPRLSQDPMPAAMRHGQFLFNTANSDLVPITKNHWVACASCHIEGRTDAVTWRFLQGPRDTPSNAGGVSDTGFLFHTADRRVVTDYWHTIDDEQGGMFSAMGDGGVAVAPTDPVLVQDLQDLQTYVNFAIPVPVPPTTDPTLVAMGKTIFESADVGCLNCHSGPAHTDSGEGNPSLSLEGHIQLHDVGTCVTTGFIDQIHDDEDGNPRYPCTPANPDPTQSYGFDTPTLRGVASSPPYFHSGSAPTILDALEQTKGKMGNITNLSQAELDALVEYVRSL